MYNLTVICGVILSLAALPASALDADIEEMAPLVREYCAADYGVDMEDINTLDGIDLIPDKKLKCYILCFMENMEMMSEGKVDVRGVVSLMSEDLRKKTEHDIVMCGTVKGADDCDTAFLTLKCWQKANRVNYLLN